jgi:hypothetical protein
MEEMEKEEEMSKLMGTLSSAFVFLMSTDAIKSV